jgi:hypothetical protein
MWRKKAYPANSTGLRPRRLGRPVDPRAQQLSSNYAAYERGVSITGSNASTYQMSHSEKFDNPLSFNGPVDADPPSYPIPPPCKEGARSATVSAYLSAVAQTFLSAGAGDFPVPSF